MLRLLPGKREGCGSHGCQVWRSHLTRHDAGNERGLSAVRSKAVDITRSNHESIGPTRVQACHEVRFTEGIVATIVDWEELIVVTKAIIHLEVESKKHEVGGDVFSPPPDHHLYCVVLWEELIVSGVSSGCSTDYRWRANACNQMQRVVRVTINICSNVDEAIDCAKDEGVRGNGSGIGRGRTIIVGQLRRVANWAEAGAVISEDFVLGDWRAAILG